MHPLVSVIVPVYNSINYIKDCVESVLNQTYNNIELILIDDGSKDESYEHILKYYSKLKNVKVITHENRQNKGVTETRRLGIKSASGEYLAFLDADDYFEIDKIQNQIEIISNNPEIVLVHSRIKFISEISNDKFCYDFSLGDNDKKYNIDLNEFINVNHICNSTVLVRKDLFNKISFTVNQAFQYEDWIQWVLLSQYGQFYYMNTITCNYRYHSASSTANHNKNGKTNLYANFEKKAEAAV